MRIRSNEPCWCGSRTKFKRCHGDHERFLRPRVAGGEVSAMLTVPDDIPRPPYLATGGWPAERGGFQIHDAQELDRLRVAGRVAAEVLIETGLEVRPGISTDELDRIAHAAYVRRGAHPSDLGYKGYTKSICTSVNDVVCHGIPDSRVLVEGDIVNIDVTAFIEGMHGDTSATFAVGELDVPTAALVEATAAATLHGISAIRAGGRLRDVGRAVESVAMRRGFSVVRDYGGHGIGAIFHAAPHVFHHDERDDPEYTTTVLVPGMTFTVEPMLNAGTHEHTEWKDHWTVVTRDGLPSAQFEHSVVVTETGVEILTVTAEGDSAVRWPNRSTSDGTAAVTTGSTHH